MTDKEINELKDKLFYKPKFAYDEYDEKALSEMEEFSKGYIEFIDKCRIEREAVRYSIAEAEKHGYKEYRIGDKFEKGGRYYYNNRGKAAAFIRVGKKPITEGVCIVASHIDSPRLDLKQHPLYENSGFAYFKTHYYGGIKKYQWTTIPLSLHGTIVRADGSVQDIAIGLDPNRYSISPTCSFILPGSDEQALHSGIEASSSTYCSVLVRSPAHSRMSATGSNSAMKLIHDKYGITEADFMSSGSRWSVLSRPRTRIRPLDDSRIRPRRPCLRISVYKALFDSTDDKNTSLIILSDKEEIGSDGVTGMQSLAYMDIIDELAKTFRASPAKVRANSMCLSADVNAGFDPGFPEVAERSNTCFLNQGVVMTKFTGSGGKSGTSDASGEFVGKIRRIFDDANVIWQTGELGKVDQGGGGTVAMYIANNNIDTIDVGVPVLSMHSPYEVIAKADLYETYKAFRAFIDWAK